MFQSLATNGLTYFFFAVEVNDVWWFISLTNISPSCTFAFFLLRQKKNLDKTIYSPALKDEVSQAWVGGWITPTILTNIRVGRHFQGCGGHFQGCRAAVTGTWLFSQLLLVELWNDEKHCKHCRQQWQHSFLGFLYLHQLGAQQHNLSNLQHCC